MPRRTKDRERFKFFLNPYQDARWTRCPRCENKTKLRKVPLLILVEPHHFIALNKTCRYCPTCDLLIAHRDELEGELTVIFESRAPEAIGNPYEVLGTLDRSDWQRGAKPMGTPLTTGELAGTAYEFRQVLSFKLAPRWVYEPPTGERAAGGYGTE